MTHYIEKVFTSIEKDMKNYFGLDLKRITHALEVLSYAKRILDEEKGDIKIVIPAAILHDIGIKECERKYNATHGHLQEVEGPPIAKKILQENKVDDKLTDEICMIIANHHTKDGLDSINFDIIWDADMLVNLKETAIINKDNSKVTAIIERNFRTQEGKIIAKEVYL